MGEVHDLFKGHALSYRLFGKAIELAIVLVPHDQPELRRPDAKTIGDVFQRRIKQQRFGDVGRARVHLPHQYPSVSLHS
ncbi:hypothetical protein D3C86_2195800 [compost metagenome]